LQIEAPLAAEGRVDYKKFISEVGRNCSSMVYDLLQYSSQPVWRLSFLFWLIRAAKAVPSAAQDK